MPQSSGSFEQLSVWFHNINAGPAANSAQANWIAGASEAQQLADELTRDMSRLQQFWSGPAATEFYNSMNKIIRFAQQLSTDMMNMGAGLAQMAMQAQAIQPGALSLIAAASSNPWSRAAAIAPLNAMINALGGSYLSNKSTYWKEPTADPQQLPKADTGTVDNPQKSGDPGTVRGTSLLDRLTQSLELIKAAVSAYQAFKESDFASGNGDYTLPIDNGGPPPSVSPGPGTNPDYDPLPLPDPSLTDPDSTGLAGAPSMGTPAVSLAAGAGAVPMSAPGGAMPMGMGGMGMGMMGAGGASPSMAASKGNNAMGGGMFGPGMMGAGRGNKQEEDSGQHTWLTEDEMVWNGEAAPAGVVGK